MLLVSASLSTLKSGKLGLLAILVEGRVNILASDVQSLGETSELRTNDLGRGALEALNNLSTGGTSTATRVKGTSRREDVRVESQDTSSVVDTDGQVTLLATVHDEFLNCGGAHLELLGELSEVENKLELDSLVDLGKLLEEAGKNDLLERQDVLLHLRVGGNLGKNRRDSLADGQGVEVDLEDVVELTDLGGGALEKTLVDSILEQNGTGRGCRHAEEVSKTGVLVLLGLVNVDQSTTGTGSADDGDGESRENDKGGGLGEVCIANVRGVVLLLALASSHDSGRLAQEVAVAAPGSSVEKVVLADEEDTGKLLEVVGHHDVLSRTLAQGKKSVGVLDRLEGLLPQLELNSNVELLEASVEMALKSVGVAEVDGVHLGRVLGGILEMVAEQLAQSAEFGLAGVTETELEGLEGDGLVHNLESGVVLENVQNGAVSLPQEFEPGSDNGAVGSVACLLAGDGRQEDGLRGLTGLEITNIGQVGRCLCGGRDLISLGLGFGNLGFSEFDEALEDKLDVCQWERGQSNRVVQVYLDSGDVCILRSVLVVVETVLGGLALSQLNTKFNEQEDDRLKRSNSAVAGALGSDMLVEDGQSRLLLVDCDELLRSLLSPCR